MIFNHSILKYLFIIFSAKISEQKGEDMHVYMTILNSFFSIGNTLQLNETDLMLS